MTLLSCEVFMQVTPKNFSVTEDLAFLQGCQKWGSNSFRPGYKFQAVGGKEIIH
jgi:hypothetical protein